MRRYKLFNRSKTNSAKDKIKEEHLPKSLYEKIEKIRPYFEKNIDIVHEVFYINGDIRSPVYIIYMESVTEIPLLNKGIIQPLLSLDPVYWVKTAKHNIAETVRNSFLTGRVSTVLTSLNEIIVSIFNGNTIIMFDGCSKVLAVDIKGGKTRSLTEPVLDKNICGPREGFIEDWMTNISLIRRKLKDPNLVVEKMTVGTRTKTQVAILYIKDIMDDSIVNKIKKRVQSINSDHLISTGQLVQYINRKPMALFALSREVERADIVVGSLLEGRAAVIVDQSTLVAIYPTLFVETMQATDDYSQQALTATFMRFFRYLAFFMAISLPALYISLISFQQELIPFELIIPLAKSRAQVPFPAIIEALVLEIILQFIFESGIRLPVPLGQTIGVVSGIILGQAAISANLASPAMIIIISLTTICTFALPSFCLSLSCRIIRMIMIFLSGTFGLFGFSFGWLLILAHLIDLESVGVPYFAPFAPTRYKDLKDTIVKVSPWNMKDRPMSIPMKDRKRQPENDRSMQDE